MSKQFALQQPGRDGRAIELHQRPALAPAAIVDCTGDQFFSCACLAQKQDRGIAGRHCLHQTKNVTEARALAHNSLEIHLAADFFFQIQLLLGQLVFKFRNFTINNRIFDCDRHLARYLSQEIDLVLIECVLFPPRHSQHTEHAFSTDKGQVTEGVQPFAFGFSVHLFRNGLAIQLVQDDGFTGLKSITGQGPLDRHQGALGEDTSVVRKVQRMYPQVLAFLVRQHHSRRVGTHDTPNAGGDCMQ